METGKETIVAIATGVGIGKDHAEKFASVFVDSFRARRQIDAVNAELENERKRHEAAIQELKTRRRSIQQQCGHPSATFHGDPSGGSDSFHECVVCGHQW